MRTIEEIILLFFSTINYVGTTGVQPLGCHLTPFGVFHGYYLLKSRKIAPLIFTELLYAGVSNP